MDKNNNAKFAHLHVHTDYSLLDGLGKINDYVKTGLSLGMNAMAFTDHGTMAGLVTAYDTCKKYGMKFIGGFEAYTAPYGTSRFDKKMLGEKAYNHLVILFKNEIGYKNGCILLTRSNTEGFYYKPRIDFELLKEHHEGLIVTSACLAGAIPKAILAGDIEKARKIIMDYKEVFGEDFYLEIQDHGFADDRVVITELLRLSSECGVKLIATNDCHYVHKDDKEAHNWLLCMQMEKKIGEENRMINDGDYYLKSEQEMLDLFPYCTEAVYNTQEIVDKCNFEFDYGHYRMPRVRIPRKYGDDYYKYLEDEAWKGYEMRYPAGHINRQKAKPRLEYELGIIKQMNFAQYFLDIRKTILEARKANILVGPGRGSGAGSCLNYCLGITDLDPLRYDLLFERYVTMSAAVALNYPHDNNFKENIQNYTNQYQQKHGKLSINTEKERIMALLEGASRIDTADRINFVVNKKQNAPNVFQEETHNAMEAALKNIKGDDKQKFVTELAEKTFYTKQQYFLAIEAHKLNLNVKTDKETKDKKQIDKKISSISAAYEKRATFNNDRLNTEQILVAACERASGSISAQYIYDNVAKSLTGNKKAIEQLCADAQSYNKFKEQHIINTEKKKEPILKEGKFTSMANDTNASGLHHSKKIEEISKNLTVNKEATDNIIDINVGIEEQAKIFADRFNNLEKEAGPDLIEWGKTHHSEEKENLISQIDERINNKNAAENFTDIVSDNFPFCETPKSLELKFQEPEEVTEIPFEEVDINDFGFEDR